MPESTQEPSRAEIQAADKAYHAAIASEKNWDPPITAALKAAAAVRVTSALREALVVLCLADPDRPGLMVLVDEIIRREGVSMAEVYEWLDAETIDRFVGSESHRAANRRLFNYALGGTDE